MSRRDDPYGALGVDVTATTEEIQIAFRRLIRSLHPDHGDGAPPDHLAITHLVDAWHILGDPARRAAFDRSARPCDPSLWQPARPDVDHEPTVRTALLVRLLLLTTIATIASVTVLFIVAMSQSG